MKDKTARIIAIIALVFMAAFVASLILTLAGVYSNIFTYVAVGSGAVVLALFLFIKMSGKGYSITQMNNEMEMEKIREENERLIAEAKNEKKAEQPEKDEAEEQIKN